MKYDIKSYKMLENDDASKMQWKVKRNKMMYHEVKWSKIRQLPLQYGKQSCRELFWYYVRQF